MQNGDLKLAVLIDADNIPGRSIKAIMEEIAIYGTPTIKRIYGDFTKPELSGWRSEMLEVGILPVQHFGYTVGKNSTDTAMIIDAMDILYGENVDGFCIVSSDSDFTRLALRLRESGVKVFGFGEKKTPQPFRVACDKFIYIEVLTGASTAVTPTTPRRRSTAGGGKVPKETVEGILSTIHDLGDENGWVFLGELGNLLLKKQPDFDPRNFGFRTLTPLVKSIAALEVDERDTNNPSIKHIYVRERLS